ncbi:DNA polymerase Y family protein [Saxibacter everestensis]|uniref:DNA polymerase Y family protein n=1 Tax=Saxibacter everestensis TaxID=2909229 RepID=A0ABY8QZB8_9MICO|nr:DNA polymerase Y family protein [Brevibacteriaceae bacterium ZFBP1038]
MTEPRVIVLLCPDWPVVAAAVEANISAHRPVAVISGNEVVACSATARSAGVARGQRRRLAQLRAPDLVILDPDDDRDARLFDPVITASEHIVAQVQPIHPGILAVGVESPRQYFGSELAATEKLLTHLTDSTGYEIMVGIADTIFAGTIAAARSARVQAGGTADFLAPLPIDELIRPEVPAWTNRYELVDLLQRLGLRTLGAFAALSSTEVANRFGPDAMLAHRQAGGLPGLPMAGRRPETPLVVERLLDPPADRIDSAAFAAISLAEEFLQLVHARGLVCSQIRVEARTDGGQSTVRVWRHDVSLTARDIADRTRWQLDGWLSSFSRNRKRGGSRSGPDAGPGGGAGSGPGPGAAADATDEADRDEAGSAIVLLRLEAEEVSTPGSWQHTVFDDKRENDEKVRRTISRVQGLIGAGKVLSGSLQGGRDATQENLWTPWQQPAASLLPRKAPWPGRLPSPHPVRLMHEEVRVLDPRGRSVTVGIAEGLSDRPAVLLRLDDKDRPFSLPVVSWSGAWPLETQWWDPDAARRRARLQFIVQTGEAFLLTCESGRWWIEGCYE